MTQYLLAIDQGTTNSRAIIFDVAGKLIAQSEISLAQSFLQNGWVEQDAEEMLGNTIACVRQVLSSANLAAKDIAALGISNQRETTIVWDKASGKPIYPAIVWQDRRTSQLCSELVEQPIAEAIQSKTGLMLDSYFSATKIMWILDNVPQARARANANELLFGTVDCYLLWHLTAGKVHATDATNASRTMLYNIVGQKWDDELLQLFTIPHQILPMVMDNSAQFGCTEQSLFGEEIIIGGMVGDQQAAAIGQACFVPGMVKSTYGTGCFVLMNTGKILGHSKNKLLSTIAYRLNGEVTYALEGSIFSAGSSVKWLRDKLHIIKTAAETEILAASVPDTGGVYFIPAFTGLGAPHWRPDARAAIMGITRGTEVAHIVRAALEAVAYQTHDLLEAMSLDSGEQVTILRVDGGMVSNNWLLQYLANILNIEIQPCNCSEASALGAAFLAGLSVGIYHSLDDIAKLWQSDRKFVPNMDPNTRQKSLTAWQQAINRI